MANAKEHPALIERDFFLQYLDYTAGTEVPTTFNRWAILAGLSAYLGKSVYLRLGEERIYPNLYCLLLGSPGTRKSTAIKDMKRFLSAAGYTTFAHAKTSKEQFLQDLSDGFGTESETEFNIDAQLFGGGSDVATASEVFVSPDEFTEFFGNNILEFVSTLGDLWNYEGTYRSRLKNSASVTIHNPHVTLIGGTTPVTLNETFPLTVIGQGFFSRLIFVHGVPNGRRIAFPKPRDPEKTEYLVDIFSKLRYSVSGEMTLTDGAVSLVEKIYRAKEFPVDDSRFQYYAGRRQTQLLKLSMLVTIASGGKEIEPVHVARANTLLSAAEHFMPAALGEFGASKHSVVVHRILAWLDTASAPVQITDIWAHVVLDMDKLSDLQNIMSGLVTAGKVQATEKGILIKKKPLLETESPMYDWDYLTAEEKGYG